MEAQQKGGGASLSASITGGVKIWGSPTIEVNVGNDTFGASFKAVCEIRVEPGPVSFGVNLTTTELPCDQKNCTETALSGGWSPAFVGEVSSKAELRLWGSAREVDIGIQINIESSVSANYTFRTSPCQDSSSGGVNIGAGTAVVKVSLPGVEPYIASYPLWNGTSF